MPYACICVRMHAYACICMHVHVYACICMHIHAYACVCIHVHAYAGTCMHMFEFLNNVKENLSSVCPALHHLFFRNADGHQQTYNLVTVLAHNGMQLMLKTVANINEIISFMSARWRKTKSYHFWANSAVSKSSNPGSKLDACRKLQKIILNSRSHLYIYIYIYIYSI